MPSPLPRNSTYKKRVVTAMLEDQTFDDLSSPLPSHRSRTSARTLSYYVLALAFACAVGVFLLLYRHDNSVLSRTQSPASTPGQSERLSQIPAPRSTATEAQHSLGGLDQTDHSTPIQKPAEISSAPSATPLQSSIDKGPAAEPVPFALKRWKKFQSVGPIALRLVRVNPRRRTCDVSIAEKGHRTIQRRFQLARATQIQTGLRTPVLQLTVSAMTKDSISGFVLEMPASSQSSVR